MKTCILLLGAAFFVAGIPSLEAGDRCNQRVYYSSPRPTNYIVNRTDRQNCATPRDGVTYVQPVYQQRVVPCVQTVVVPQVQQVVVTQRVARPVSYCQDRTVVLAVQRVLRQRGYYLGPCNGLYGASLRTAVVKYQQRCGLPITGLIDQHVVGNLF